jgi:hypothetical protein
MARSILIQPEPFEFESESAFGTFETGEFEQESPFGEAEAPFGAFNLPWLPPSSTGFEFERDNNTSEGETAAWAQGYPPSVREVISQGAALWPLAMQRAIEAGIRDSSRLANLAFFMHHPERNGRAIDPNEPGASNLIALWKFLRDTARNMLQGSPTPATRDQRAAPNDGDKPGTCKILYRIVPGEPFGRTWKGKDKRPPGLPKGTKEASAPCEALRYIKKLAAELADERKLDPAFVTAVTRLAVIESSARFALPARYPHSAKSGWGAFQWNLTLWKGAAKVSEPWSLSSCEELEIPIRVYAKKFADVIAAGGDSIDATGGLLLWHRSPTSFIRWLNNGRIRGFRTAWAKLGQLREHVLCFLCGGNIVAKGASALGVKNTCSSMNGCRRRLLTTDCLAPKPSKLPTAPIDPGA